VKKSLVEKALTLSLR